MRGQKTLTPFPLSESLFDLLTINLLLNNTCYEYYSLPLKIKISS